MRPPSYKIRGPMANPRLDRPARGAADGGTHAGGGESAAAGGQAAGARGDARPRSGSRSAAGVIEDPDAGVLPRGGGDGPDRRSICWKRPTGRSCATRIDLLDGLRRRRLDSRGPEQPRQPRSDRRQPDRGDAEGRRARRAEPDHVLRQPPGPRRSRGDRQLRHRRSIASRAPPSSTASRSAWSC